METCYVGYLTVSEFICLSVCLSVSQAASQSVSQSIIQSQLLKLEN